MKHLKPCATAALLALSAVSAQAQSEPAMTPVRPYLGIFLTAGGDNLATVQVQNAFGDIENRRIEAGGLVDLKAGIEFLLNPAFSMRGTVGYHIDAISAENGDMRFSRFPFEVMAIWHPGPPLHLGLGMRFATGASLSGSGAAAIRTIDYDADPGIVLEGEYQFSPAVGVALRLVSESYKAKVPFAGKFDGTHVGIGLNFHF